MKAMKASGDVKCRSVNTVSDSEGCFVVF